MARARVVSVAETFKVAMQATADATRRAIADTARREHGRVLTTDPRPISFTRIVDGVNGASEDAVRANGVIVYRYPRLEAVVAEAMDTLFRLSPVLIGEYRRLHVMFLNGQPVASLKGMSETDEVAITNTVPYARKIELGKMKMRVPGTDRVYQQAARKLRAKYGALVDIEYTFRAVIDGRQINQSKVSARRKGNNRKGPTTLREHNKSDLRFPTIVIKAR